MKQKLLLFINLFLASAAFSQDPCSTGRYASDVYPNVTLNSNIVYGQNMSFTNQNTSLKLDFYEPSGDTALSRPLIIWAHGGSFIGGSKTDSDVSSLSQRFAKKGYACASIDYRLGFFPIDSANSVKAVVRAVQDMKAAIRFFYKDRADGTNLYKIDTNRIYIGGSSAGAITALHVAYLDSACKISDYLNSATIQALGGLEGASGNPGYSSTVQGVINLCGALARYSWMEADDVPLVSVHGTNDGTVKYNRGVVNPGTPLMYLDGSRMLHERACALNLDNNFYTFPGAPHVPFAGSSANAVAYMDTTSNFIRDFLIGQFGCNNALLQPANLPMQTAYLYPINDCSGNSITDLCLSSGLEELNSTSFEMYPNPTSGNISVKHKIQGMVEIAVYDLTGRIVFMEKSANSTVLLNLNQLKTGTYILSLKDLATSIISKESIIIE
jgi:poly(3-hydroxybutyrate) depolymerase